VAFTYGTGLSVSGGTIELRWSQACGANWTRFTATADSSWTIYVERQSPEDQEADGPVNLAAGGQWYTNIVYAPHAARACVLAAGVAVPDCTPYTN
jgi:hypothetical protein